MHAPLNELNTTNVTYKNQNVIYGILQMLHIFSKQSRIVYTIQAIVTVLILYGTK